MNPNDAILLTQKETLMSQIKDKAWKVLKADGNIIEVQDPDTQTIHEIDKSILQTMLTEGTGGIPLLNFAISLKLDGVNLDNAIAVKASIERKPFKAIV